jgi:hypothetical protein
MFITVPDEVHEKLETYIGWLLKGSMPLSNKTTKRIKPTNIRKRIKKERIYAFFLATAFIKIRYP